MVCIAQARWVLPSCKVWHLSYTVYSVRENRTIESFCHIQTIGQPAGQPYTDDYIKSDFSSQSKTSYLLTYCQSTKPWTWNSCVVRWWGFCLFFAGSGGRSLLFFLSFFLRGRGMGVCILLPRLGLSHGKLSSLFPEEGSSDQVALAPSLVLQIFASHCSSSANGMHMSVGCTIYWVSPPPPPLIVGMKDKGDTNSGDKPLTIILS